MGLVAQDLSFRYPGADKNVLRGINLTIPPGTTLAIVGVNGGGKTTLVKVLMGLYDHQGSLLLNGQPIASYDPATVHKRTSCLFQDFSKYSFTLRENIGIGNVGRMEDEAAIKEAIERGGATAVLDKVGMEGRETSIRPKSHHSGVPEQRASLSGGQWQRVALGRAFMRANEADLVVFDEPSASLDPRAEAQLFERIHSLSHQHGRRSSTIFISHRLSTVKRADQIAVVEDGTILECGTHAELMAKEGRYSELFRLQKAGFED
ncbi:P-loop containing nucleoside triphosphate hydrolase protein [Dioszegia hungarica]|uniref:P-loop containing nucleoside triphosphate hydrolase protein n=1 Tax=Dioszegia hungarica TaxID=4972 RepID=A0AA38H3I8_9TREE|nr:P-loop containing nucleoside triphosphate hydrolase protein [Dioszegia hungarica]KAI9633141.1 P-loop containing nucleoside triphosphate hydrolase protein [Dioszegia hungarica]